MPEANFWFCAGKATAETALIVEHRIVTRMYTMCTYYACVELQHFINHSKGAS